jgi:type IV secretory pathway TrbD component
MNVKDLVKTKTFWSGLGLAVYGLVVQDWQSVLTGLSVVFLRDAINKVQDREDKNGFP